MNSEAVGPAGGLGDYTPLLVRVGRGRSSQTAKEPARLARDGYSLYMYQVDVG